MNANRIIYLINQSSKLRKAWRDLSDGQKRAVLSEASEHAEEEEDENLAKIIEEIACGQRRLF